MRVPPMNLGPTLLDRLAELLHLPGQLMERQHPHTGLHRRAMELLLLDMAQHLPATDSPPLRTRMPSTSNLGR